MSDTKPKKRKTKTLDKKGCKRSLKRISWVFLSVVLIIVIGISAYVYRLLKQTSYVDVPIVDELSISEGILDDLSEPEDNSEPDEIYDVSQNSTINTSQPKASKPSLWGEDRIHVYVDSRFPIIKVGRKSKDVENFLVFGLDASSSYDSRSRADSIIIASVNTRNNTIKLTSIMRDTQVKISGRTALNKINAAYAFGGVGLLINTINQTFDLDIQKFAMVDFWSSENVINSIGGVYIDITNEEIPYINGGVSGANYKFKNISESSPYVKTSGNVLLNGRQAVAYGRIRKLGSDTARTQRQRTVLTQAIIQFKAAPPSQKLAVFDQASKSFETNVNVNEMIFLAFDLLQSMKNIQQYRVPESGMYTSNTTNYQLKINYSLQLPALHQFIWGEDTKHVIELPDELPEPTMTPIEIPTLSPQPTPTGYQTGSPTITPVVTISATPTHGITITITPNITALPTFSLSPTPSISLP